MFQNKFYPCSFCDMKRNDLLSLVQGSATIVEYEKKFNELTKYALAFIIVEVHKCKHFQDGLKNINSTPVTATSHWSDFSKLVEATM